VNATEISLNKATTVLALACAAIASASAASILARDAVPAAGSETAIHGPVANRDSKADKFAVSARAMSQNDATAEAQDVVASVQPVAAGAGQPVRLAYAAEGFGEFAAPPQIAAPTAAAYPVQPKPKLAAKPAVPKPAAVLSDAQIAAIKGRLNLSSSQEYYWPSVEQALRAVARKLNAAHRGSDVAVAPAIDPDSAEVQQLKYAAMPLLFQLREDQKQEVRKLARLMGLNEVAAQI
jgi:hypothetical protein